MQTVKWELLQPLANHSPRFSRSGEPASRGSSLGSVSSMLERGEDLDQQVSPTADILLF